MDNYRDRVSGKVASVMKPSTAQAASCLTNRESSIFRQSITGVGAFYV